MTRRLCYVANPGWPHVEKWARWFAGREGYEVHIVSESRPGYDEVRWHPLRIEGPRPLPWTIRAQRAFAAAFKAIQPSLVHLHNLEYGMFPAALAWRGPMVLTTYGLDITRFESRGDSWRARMAKRHLLRRAEAVTAASRFLARRTMEIGGLPEEKVFVTPFGVDTRAFSRRAPARTDGLTVLGMPKDIKPEYAPLDFIRAFELLRRKGRRIRGFIQGEGPLRAQAEGLVQELGLTEMFEIRGRVPLQNMPQVYEEMNICVLPSLQESFGVAALEAQSMEVPVVASRVEGLSEVLVDGVTGFHVPPAAPEIIAERLDRLILDPALLDSMGKAGRRFVEQHFDWEVNARAMEDIYERHIGSPQKRPLLRCGDKFESSRIGNASRP
ncbi:glycosyl transferase group 1 [Alkalidesulfovibrio alkalitolerans DSM 16529]|uniref:Glycosyl transferase group 1 n=1 Tax=Alkalidesulfovibrio alkalitolerans DSM 16529 TaxID=1121439 RepID=S7T0G3_9BACT|nr:glycosyltransferase family 4 protein [Alkalidesulfovibrio alkalitolerans]EPR30567.1 glycosyl transferase group 1 [Alkalidesulfovibrio alkalitolerans DSM 16529]